MKSQEIISDVQLHVRDWQSSVLFPGQVQPGEAHKGFLFKLTEAVLAGQQEVGQRSGFTVTAAGMRWRVQRMQAYRYACRLVMNRAPKLPELRLLDCHVSMMLSDELKKSGGLVLFSGLTGSGKTTTLNAMLVSRLEKFGGFAQTVEDPVEIVIEGWHGEGYCTQIDVMDSAMGGEVQFDRRFAEAITTSLRSFPARDRSMLMIGEVRDAHSAAELLRIAVDGHLVLSTIHSRDIPSALRRLASLARAGGETQADQFVADSLRMVFHQRLDAGVPQMTSLDTRERKDLYQFLCKGEYARLEGEVDLQRRRNIQIRSM
ncbi:ATPase, T2SS/T4P/T4SS family [Chromobacterium sp. IIBBL 290-4]|uniref:ATPase, T2SS/T4P/T4SS family n=1 Tax=Chromobacterium sp. IIBBL 290-4 TaxID=2953890 RepID=UPI0020B7A813|nr:ATPase, T2SS/T4P/T4SS family [Chromobacterium sp. IIBBL 290-4]UTH74131.1 GspE family protein [Chromobacterium sp. IIBBL 290-4]